MPTPSELDSAPTAWAVWRQADTRAHHAIDRAARLLVDEGLIKATQAADRTIVHAQITSAGLRHMEDLNRGRSSKGE